MKCGPWRPRLGAWSAAPTFGLGDCEWCTPPCSAAPAPGAGGTQGGPGAAGRKAAPGRRDAESLEGPVRRRGGLGAGGGKWPSFSLRSHRV